MAPEDGGGGRAARSLLSRTVRVLSMVLFCCELKSELAAEKIQVAEPVALYPSLSLSYRVRSLPIVSSVVRRVVARRARWIASLASAPPPSSRRLPRGRRRRRRRRRRLRYRGPPALALALLLALVLVPSAADDDERSARVVQEVVARAANERIERNGMEWVGSGGRTGGRVVASTPAAIFYFSTCSRREKTRRSNPARRTFRRKTPSSDPFRAAPSRSRRREAPSRGCISPRRRSSCPSRRA